MKTKITQYIFYLFLLMPFAAGAQVWDDFSDGDFTNNPAWTGNDTSFEVLSGQLHSIDSNASSIFYLSTPSSLATTAQWEFWANLKFNTSSLNYVDVYLISDVADLKAAGINGYFVRIGNTTDEISLYVRTGATSIKIIDGADGILNSSNNIMKIRITRNALNLWTLERDMTGTGNSYVTEGTVTDATFSTGNFFGIYISQSTSSFFGKHYFDDIAVGPLIADTISPQISSLSVISQNQLDVYFNESVEQTSAETPGNYFVNNGIGTPSTAVRNAGNFKLVTLTFPNNFVNASSYTITITGVQDLSANAVVSDSATFSYYVPQVRDVVFNEFMADITPTIPPPFPLPSYEYLELYNRTNFPINLNGWKLADASSSDTLPNITILPDSFFVLTSTTGELALSIYTTQVKGIPSFPSLNDSGDDMVLRDASGNIISVAHYRPEWYNNTLKDDGGWSLEQIDPDNPCAGINNWLASNDSRGGTPGRKNSVWGNNSDATTPKFLRASVITPDTVQFFFTEPMDSASVMSISSYTIDNGIGNPLSVNPVEPDYSSVLVALPVPISAGIIYTATASAALQDCAGNFFNVSSSVKFAIAQPVSPNDIVINELMPDPKESGVEWVEIYNRSQKVIDLKEMFIASRSTTTGTLTDIQQISTVGFLIFPMDYFVLSTSGSVVRSQYNTPNPEGFIDMSSMPALVNDSDWVVLLNAAQTVIDEVNYNNDWHLPLLNDTKGISLERIDYDQSAQDKTNWHSAAESVGGATPAYKNSQYTSGETGSEVTLLPEVFSPDNDGYNDVLTINYSFDTPGMIANVRIYDSRGREIKNLVRNELLGKNGYFVWDGFTDDKLKARVGIYIVYFEAFSEKGDVKKYKKPCVVAGRF